ncbi:hypothetical protein XELAEV_18040690mg [Xenopus laevis]|uniref:Ig-like domain-containing protein n=1 Tax=Xenopus laevis TaxID=8355 RepID=A0A974CB51_XENLA|nr:hypothetical protein XELAEV_18040690mg [Xenopus laevis]
MNYLVILQAPPSIREGDSLSLRCHSRLENNRGKDQFYKNGNLITTLASGSVYSLGNAAPHMTGTYKCAKSSVSSSVRNSKEKRIHVEELFNIPHIKVNPGDILEGDHVTITCDIELRATTELQFAFYRNGHNVQGFNSSNQYGVSSAQLEDSGNYTCEVQTPTSSVRKRSTMTLIWIQELFLNPLIKVSPDQVTEGDHMTITCDTKLSPHRETTELQFVFYRNGHNVQGFNSSNQYGVPSAQLEDSGNYTCEVQTPTGSVRKRSNVAHFWILERRQKHLIPVLIGILVGVLVISAAIIIFKFRHKILSLLMSQHLEPKTGINVCRTADRTLQRSENKDNSELDDYQPVNNIGGRNPSLTEDSTYVNIKHVWKPTRTLLPKQDKYLVTYAVVRRSSRGIEIQEPSGQESLESSCIYENFKATSFQVDSSHF